MEIKNQFDVEDKGIEGNTPEGFKKDLPKVSEGEKTFAVIFFWSLLLGFLYVTFFVSIAGFCILPLVAMFKSWWIDKHGVAVLPKSITTWWSGTCVYDIFIRRVQGNKKLFAYRTIALWLFGFSLFFVLLPITHPIIDLSDMMVAKGRFESFHKLGRRNPCGHSVLTFRQEDGKLVRFYSVEREADAKILKQNKGELYTLWVQPNTINMFADCRTYADIMQIQGKGYVRLYDKKWAEKVNRQCINLSIFLLICGGLCLRRIAWANR